MRGQQGLYRLRVGTYRILFRIDHHEQIIYIELHRGDWKSRRPILTSLY